MQNYKSNRNCKESKNGQKNNPRKYGKGQEYKRDDLNDTKRFPNKGDLRGKSKGRNDASWYRVDSQIMKDAASLSFATTYGMPFDLKEAAGGLTSVTANDAMPGIMTFNVLPTFGNLTDWSSPFNVAIRDMYTFIRHQNSGHSNYDASNLGMYLMAYDSAATYYAFMVRLYGLTRTVLVQNAYTPRDLVTAAGGNYTNIVSSLADLRGYINSYAVRLNAMRVPSKWHVLERHMWLFTHVFADSPTNKASFYVFAPAGLWKYTLAATPATTGLSPTGLAGRKLNVNEIKATGEQFLDSILNDEDFNIMSGDILKAYGDNTFSLNMISEDYSVMPVYDPEVLMQIHNASILMAPDVQWINDHMANFTIREDTSETTNVGALIMSNAIALDTKDDSNYNKSIAYCCLKRVLDVPTPNPDPATVCVATRLMINLDANTGENNVALTDVGTELILGTFVMAAPNTGEVGSPATAVQPWDLEKFDWHPYVYKGSVQLQTGTLHGTEMYGLQGDIDNYAIISHDTLSNIHRAAMLGMFEMV